MNPDNVPPWGCPWHGLVKGGQVYLPNGTQRPYPQPPGAGWRAGCAALIARPDMPVIETPDEQTAAGMEWRNTAILAGKSGLHGRSLGAGAWVYIDPAGDRWRVTTTLNTANLLTPPSAVTVKLERFGVLGGLPQAYEYSIPMPDLGQGAPSIGTVNAIRAITFDLKPRGESVIFMVYTNWLTTASGPQPTDHFGDIPIGWLELTLSGPGAECVFTLQTLKTRAQTLGIATGANSPDWVMEKFSLVTETDIEWTSPTRRVVTQQVVRVERDPTSSGFFDFALSADPVSVSVSGRVMALWYQGGGISELTLSVSEDRSWELTSPALELGGSVEVYEGDERISFEYEDTVVTWSGAGISEFQATLALDGVPCSSLSYRVERALAAEYREALSGQTVTHTNLGDYNGVTEESQQIFYSDSGFWPAVMATVPTPTQILFPAGELWLSWLNRFAALPGAGGTSFSASAYRGSNKVFGLCVSDSSTRGIRSPLATPGGSTPADIPTHGLGGFGNPALFASISPLTSQVALDSDHVCWV